MRTKDVFKNKIRRIDIYFSLLVFAITLFFTKGLFSIHYTSDSYNYFSMGFKEYALKWFLPVGRVIGTIVLFIVDKLNIDFFCYQRIMLGISILIVNATIMILYKIILNVGKFENSGVLMKLFILIVSIFTIINNGSYQFFYYSESAVMWLGVLISILMLKAFLSNEHPIQVLLLSILAVCCYQSIVLIVVPLAIILVFYKENFNLLNTIKRLSYLALAIGIAFGIDYLILIIAKRSLMVETYRDTSIKFKFSEIIRAFKDTTGCYDNFPMQIKTNYLLIFEMLLACANEKNYKYDKIKSIGISILSFISAAILPTLVMGILDFYFADRIIYSYTSVIGISFIFLIIYFDFDNMKEIRKAFFGIAAFFILMIDIFEFNFITQEHIYTNKIDLGIGNYIANRIEEYELESGNEVKTIVYCYDNNLTFNYLNSKKIGEATRRGLSGDWCFDNILNYIMNRNFEKEKNQGIYETIFKGKNWDEFSDEQIVFEGEKMYYCIY